MSNDIVISVENLGKKYRIRHQKPERYTALCDVLADKLTAPWRSLTSRLRNEAATTNGNGGSASHNFGISASQPFGISPAPPAQEDFWALKDVSFEVKQGEVVGIIGHNGAGKSTLLKILSQITEPTTGEVRLRGRVASLLEVGTGFHPELTGRENIFLNGAVLGMMKKEIRAKFDEIVDFAGVERFLDTPVKRYSSGMYVRLAFAVAAHLEPEVLVVDEVLAVGDAEFQKKCLGKMGKVARSGRTVLFVSHNLTALRSLCSEGFLLNKGKLTHAGCISEVLAAYSEENGSSTRSYPEESIVRRVAVEQDLDRIVLELEYADLRGKLTYPGFSFVIHDVDGRAILGHHPLLDPCNVEASWPLNGVVRASITSPKLLDGVYLVSVFFGDSYATIFTDPHCLTFTVSGLVNANYQLEAERAGPVYPECEYEFLQKT